MERDQEWFEKHAKKCNTCGNIPTMVQVTDLFKVNQVLGYKVYCEDCKWEWGDGGGNQNLQITRKCCSSMESKNEERKG